jgi:hypothetical protein
MTAATGYAVVPGRAAGANPESDARVLWMFLDSVFAAPRRPGMTNRKSSNV